MVPCTLDTPSKFSFIKFIICNLSLVARHGSLAGLPAPHVVSNTGSNGNGSHEPGVVGHKDKPVLVLRVFPT